MGNKLFHGSCHGLIKNRIEFSVVGHGRIDNNALPPTTKTADGINHHINLGRTCQKAAVNGIKGKAQFLPLIHGRCHFICKVLTMELAIGQVIAVKGSREGTDLASQG